MKVYSNFLTSGKFKHPDLIDFIRVMEKTSGLELDWYYDYWVNSTHTIDYGVQAVEENKGKSIVTLEKVGVMPMPMDIYVTYQDGSKEIFYAPLSIMRGEKNNESTLKRTILSDWPWTNATYSFEINKKVSDIKSIELDETGLMADIDRSNNKWMGAN